MKFAGTLAVSCVAEEKLVASGKEFHKTNAPAAKFDPLRVMVKACPPAAAELGFSDESTGGVGVWAYAEAARRTVRKAWNLITLRLTF
jgi:hypothetical protein